MQRQPGSKFAAKPKQKLALQHAPIKKQIKLTDAEAIEWVKNAILNILFWRTPLLSGLWFSTIFLVFFLTLISDYSLLSLVCYVIILQLVLAWVLMRIGPTLSQMGIVRQGFDGRTFVLQRQALTPDEMRIATQGVTAVLHGMSVYWYDALTTNDARKVLFVTFSLFGMAVVGKIMTLTMTLFAVFILAFGLPPLYDQKREEIDEIIERVQDVTEPIIDALAARIESMLPEDDY